MALRAGGLVWVSAGALVSAGGQQAEASPAAVVQCFAVQP
jgi:hypothetical protein